MPAARPPMPAPTMITLGGGTSSGDVDVAVDVPGNRDALEHVEQRKETDAHAGHAYERGEHQIHPNLRRPHDDQVAQSALSPDELGHDRSHDCERQSDL